jgi:hypothetical protein
MNAKYENTDLEVSNTPDVMLHPLRLSEVRSQNVFRRQLFCTHEVRLESLYVITHQRHKALKGVDNVS